MNHYEARILKLRQRIKKIEENPDPTKLASNKIRYEIQLEDTQQQLDAWREGRPFSDGGGGFMAGPLARAMGFAPMGNVGVAIGATEPQKYLELARERGLPVDNACDMTSIPFAMQEGGAVPMEDVAICDPHSCTVMCLAAIFLSHTHTKDRFTYYLDVAPEENEENLKHVTDQLGEFIDFAEKKFPGKIKYNEDRLIEMQSYEEAAREPIYEMYEMRRRVPSPIAGKDAFGGGFGASTAKGLEYIRARRDEMAERIDKGIVGLPGEKLRMLWTVTRPFFMDPFEVLAKRKAAVVFYYSGPTWRSIPMKRTPYWGDRELSPLEKVAASAISSRYRTPATTWISEIIKVCGDFQIDAIINYNMVGCTATLGFKKLLEDSVENELGIPTLQLEGKQWDSSFANEAVITSQLDEFAQMCLSKKEMIGGIR
ncbi:2-hydroxyacyl-CoA dehydratase [Thermodesulfobacteriota bacterium]